MAQPEILRLENVSLKYSRMTYPAVADVTLTLVTGEVLGLLGSSGCGKTTLLRIIAGFVSPQAGTVAIAGRIVVGNNCWIPPEQRYVGMVFQDYALFPHLMVGENIAFGLRTAKKCDRASKLAQMLALVGLEGLEKRYPHELSGGQQQRVALARALAPQPKLILLDEPLSNLDVQVRLRLREEVREILHKTGTSGIFVTHDQQEALAIADKVALMQQGRLEQLGTPEEIYTQPASRFVASFVTQANFLPAKRRGNLWETEIGCFSDRSFNSELRTQNLGDLMIREEDLILQPTDDASVVVKTRHFLGREYRYCLQTPSGRKIYARTSADTALPIGTRVLVSANEQAVRFFPN